jgi:hypothetical protein
MGANEPQHQRDYETENSEESEDNEWKGKYILHHGWREPGSLWDSVVDAVSTVSEADRSTVASFYSRTHAQLIEQLFARGGSLGDPLTTGVVRFDVVDCLVAISSGGRIAVDPNGNLRNRSEENIIERIFEPDSEELTSDLEREKTDEMES